MTRELLLTQICPIEYTTDACVLVGCEHCNVKLNELLDEYDKQIRADAIEEFVRKVKERQYVLHILSDFMNCEDYGMFTVGIEQIAEELKAGGDE